MRNTLNLRVGDQVSMAVAEGMIFRAVLASYGIPLVLAMGGALAGQWLAGDGIAALGTLIGLTIGFLLLRRREQSFHDEQPDRQHPFSLQKLR